MSKSATIFAAMAAMLWMSGCADKDPVSSQNEGVDSPAAKLVVSSTKAGSALDTSRPTGIRRQTKSITANLPGGAFLNLVYIKPGTFTMGSPSSEPGHNVTESPQHQVTLTKGFYLGQYEITQGQWEAVMGTRPWEGQDNVQSARDNAISHISWNDLQSFIHRLNVAAGDSLYRLPTEAEWEYAARAGTTTRYSFGDDESLLGDYAWYFDNAWDVGEQYAHRVGTKLPNPWGLYDMYGNVYEFVQDYYEDHYPSAAQIDPQGPLVNPNPGATIVPHVRRGSGIGDVAGGWDAPDSAMRQYMGFDQDSNNDTGARLVRIKL